MDTKRRSRGRLALCMVLATLPAASHAAARPATPVLASPAGGATFEALPAFHWAPVTGAARYEFQIAADGAFGSPVLGQGLDDFTTANTYATLVTAVTNGTYWWRVRAIDAAGAVSRWSTGRRVVKAWQAAALIVAPDDSEHPVTVSYPDPVILEWSAIPYAYRYLVDVARDPGMGSSIFPGGRPDETAATAYTFTAPLAAGTYYWTVTPIDAQGHRGAVSRVASFTWTWPGVPTGLAVEDLRGDAVFDPLLRWDQVAGASAYTVEVSTSSTFAQGSTVALARTTALSWTPTQLLPNNRYYWRVHAWDADRNAGTWVTGSAFDKYFASETPSISGLALVDDPGHTLAGSHTAAPIVTWDPVPGASSYEVVVVPFDTLAVPGGCDWVPGQPTEMWDVTTAVTAWTPLAPVPPQTPAPVGGMAISFDPSRRLVDQHGYCVKVRPRSARSADGRVVVGPWTKLSDDATAGFTYDRPTIASSCGGGGPCALAAGDYVAPADGTSQTATPRLFTWAPLPGAAAYWVIVARDADFTNVVDLALTNIPAYAPRGAAPTTLSDESTQYYWTVLPAATADGSGVSASPAEVASAAFQKQSLPTNVAADLPATVTGHPTFRWEPSESARDYHLQIAADDTFANLIEDVVTAETGYTSSTTYPANARLYWRVMARDENGIELTPSATHAFQKVLETPVPSTSNPTGGGEIPTLRWNAVDGAVSYDLHAEQPDGSVVDIGDLRQPAFTPTTHVGTGVWLWKVRANFPTDLGVVHGPFAPYQPFSRTLTPPVGPTTIAVGGNRLLLRWEPKIGGVRRYRVQVSSRQDFAALVDQVETDATSWAPALVSPAYVDGGRLWWRVAAIDELLNLGAWSSAQTLTLARRLVMTQTGYPLAGVAGVVTLLITDATGRPVAGVAVRLTGAGLHGVTRRTTRSGVVAFRVRPRSRATLLFHAWKAGYRTESVRWRVP